MQSFIYGGIALDDIYLPQTTLTKVVGGSAIYASLASSIFSNTVIGGVVGADFPQDFIKELGKRKIDISLLQKSNKPSFMWQASYSQDLSEITVLKQQMNAFDDFKVSPWIKSVKIKNCAAAFIANIDPKIQLQIVQNLSPKTIKILDSMDLWIIEKRKELIKVLPYIDVFLIGEKEIYLFANGEKSIKGIVDKIMSFGPKVVVVKKGEYGMNMYGRLGTCAIPSYPLTYLVDPSGAGDCLGGVISGVLSYFNKLDPNTMITALTIGTIVASFIVEDYTFNRLQTLTLNEINIRLKRFIKQLPNENNIQMDKIFNLL